MNPFLAFFICGLAVSPPSAFAKPLRTFDEIITFAQTEDSLRKLDDLLSRLDPSLREEPPLLFPFTESGVSSSVENSSILTGTPDAKLLLRYPGAPHDSDSDILELARFNPDSKKTDSAGIYFSPGQKPKVILNPPSCLSCHGEGYGQGEFRYLMYSYPNWIALGMSHNSKLMGLPGEGSGRLATFDFERAALRSVQEQAKNPHSRYHGLAGLSWMTVNDFGIHNGEFGKKIADLNAQLLLARVLRQPNGSQWVEQLKVLHSRNDVSHARYLLNEEDSKYYNQLQSELGESLDRYYKSMITIIKEGVRKNAKLYDSERDLARLDQLNVFQASPGGRGIYDSEGKLLPSTLMDFDHDNLWWSTSLMVILKKAGIPIDMIHNGRIPPLFAVATGLEAAQITARVGYHAKNISCADHLHVK